MSAQHHSPRHHILHLQSTIGNRAVQRLIQRRLQLDQSGDTYEEQATRVAKNLITMPTLQAQHWIHGRATPEHARDTRPVQIQSVQRHPALVQRSLICWISHPFDAEARAECEEDRRARQEANRPSFSDLDGVLSNLRQAATHLQAMPSRARTLVLQARMSLSALESWARQNREAATEEITDEVVTKLESIRDRAAVIGGSAPTTTGEEGAANDIERLALDIGRLANNLLRIRNP